jgi:hypothetical protein
MEHTQGHPMTDLPKQIEGMPIRVRVTDDMVRLALEDCAKDDEGTFPPLVDQLNYSGENKARTVVRSAIIKALQVGGYVVIP